MTIETIYGERLKGRVFVYDYSNKILIISK